MLTTEQHAIIKSTIPLLEGGGEALASYFYEHLLRDHPELRPLFNQTHQSNGGQPRALANALLMYARHIDNLAPLGHLVSRIINKHVALQILPEHYPLVGAGLLKAIRDVLGAEIATSVVLAAWGAAYQQLADLFIDAETAIYTEKAEASGGWRGGRPFKIARKVQESDEITSFYLEPADCGAVLTYASGQYIGLRLEVDGAEIRRNYSLSQASNGRQYRISVKRETGGIASQFLHDQMHEGSTLDLFIPSGDFVLQDSSKPLVLISGGVGITPLLAMLQSAITQRRDIVFIHAARHAGAHAFRNEIAQLEAEHPTLKVFYLYREQRADDIRRVAYGELSQQQLSQWLPPQRDLDAYFLGPLGFMRSVRKALLDLGVPATQVRHEFFGPSSAIE